MTSDELRSSLLAELQVVEKRVRADLLAQYRADPALMARAMARLRDEENSTAPADRAAWLETFAGRGAVLYILKTLYVRVLEDQGLLRPVRLRDGGTYETFRTLFPQLGHAAYLRRVFDDAERALPDLFAATPVEIATPGGEAASAVWAVWQLAAPGGGPRFDFRGGDLDTRFIGDLYQDLDPDVKARYALLQTPRFVEEFILDRTLDPALAEFGLDEFRIIDPTCGSGHFLLGAFERLARAWRERLGDSPAGRWEAAERALAAVYGADLNEYACAMSRFRLLLALVQATGVTDLARLRTLHANVIACDSLIPWERNLELLPGTGASDQRFVAYGTAEERARNAAFFARGYHAVVGNPPYIAVKDKKKREDYRRAWPRSASGKYSLSAPMTERFLTMPLAGGRAGLIVANNFGKREFGDGLVSRVLPEVRLDLVVDTSGAYIPGHGTPTVMLFTSRVGERAADATTHIVVGKRGEPREPVDPGRGIVWSAIVAHFAEIDYEDAWIAVFGVDKKRLTTHPWVLGNKAALALYDHLAAQPRVKDLGAEAGPAVIIIEDEAFVRRYARALPLRRIVFGEDVRDWQIKASGSTVVYPYRQGGELLDASLAADELWPFRTTLWARRTFVGTFKENNRTFYEFERNRHDRLGEVGRIVIGETATNSQFVYDTSDAIFGRSAPVLTLRDADEARYRDVTAILNSSTLEFWFKQVCFPKGGDKVGEGRTPGEAWEERYVRNGSNVIEAPQPQNGGPEIDAALLALEKILETVLSGLALATPANAFQSTTTIATVIAIKERGVETLREQLVALQEDLDWNVYGAFGILDDVPQNDPAQPMGLARGDRPFEIALARRIARGEEESTWFERHGASAKTEIPERYVGAQRDILERRLALIETDPTIALLEQAVYKRRWAFEPWDTMLADAAETWLLDALEAIVRNIPSALTEADLASRLAADPKNVAIGGYAKSTKDVSLADTVSRLLAAEAIPDNPARLLTAAGLSKLIGTSTASLGNLGEAPSAEPFAPGEAVDWKRVWRLQEREDAGQTVTIEVPPPFAKTDYAHSDGWRIRGKFNIANERFIVYDELTPKRYAWGGHTVAERARLSAEAFDLRGRQSEASGAAPPAITPTVESPARCGIQFPLWDKLDELRRLADPHYADVRELAELCNRTCPCDVLAAWRATSKPTRAKRPPAKQPPAARTTASPLAPIDLDPALLDRLHETIRGTGSAGATAATLEPIAAGDRKLLTRALDALRAQARIEAQGAGRGTRYRVAENRLSLELEK
jgi:hypothetical protein